MCFFVKYNKLMLDTKMLVDFFSPAIIHASLKNNSDRWQEGAVSRRDVLRIRWVHTLGTLTQSSVCLLLHNLPGDSYQPITQAAKIQSAMKKAKNNLLVLLGTSGHGETKTCYELLCCDWGLYFIASRKGNGGSGDIEAIEGYPWKNNKITDSTCRSYCSFSVTHIS
jgi:hypothetical protein